MDEDECDTPRYELHLGGFSGKWSDVGFSALDDRPFSPAHVVKEDAGMPTQPSCLADYPAVQCGAAGPAWKPFSAEGAMLAQLMAGDSERVATVMREAQECLLAQQEQMRVLVGQGLSLPELPVDMRRYVTEQMAAPESPSCWMFPESSEAPLKKHKSGGGEWHAMFGAGDADLAAGLGLSSLDDSVLHQLGLAMGVTREVPPWTWTVPSTTLAGPGAEGHPMDMNAAGCSSGGDPVVSDSVATMDGTGPGTGDGDASAATDREEPARACDRRRLLVRHMQAYAAAGLCPASVGAVEIRVRDDVPGSYRRMINCVLPVLFGPAHEKPNALYQRPAVYRTHCEIMRLATRGRVRVRPADVRDGPADRSVGPLIHKPRASTRFVINDGWLAHFGVLGTEIRDLFDALPIDLYAA